jgi:hypothetical protein
VGETARSQEHAGLSGIKHTLNQYSIAGGVQAKLTVGRVDDPCELEADHIASQVVGMPAPGAQTEMSGPPGAEQVQRQTSADPTHQVGEGVDATVNQALSTGSGQPLDAGVREYFEPRFGYDFSQVRVHTHEQAAESARTLSAQAYTLGSDIVFAKGQYAPETPSGRWLLAHELTHVIQQGRAGQSAQRSVQRITDEALEARQMMNDVDSRANAMVQQYRSDPAGLATRLITDLSSSIDTMTDWENTQIGSRVLQRYPDQAGLGNEIARQLTNDRVRQLVALPRNGLGMLAMTVRRGGNGAEAERIMSIVVSPSHGHLFGETATRSAAVQSALGPHGAQIQSVTGGVGPTVCDEYSIIMDAMPPNLTAEAYLTEMSQDLNAAVHNSEFDRINVFRRTQQDQQRGAPAVGDVYDINILGPDNGSVMLIERTPNHFIFQTVTTPQTGTHPEYGSREFGFELLQGGGVRWYTRGVSRPGSEAAGIVGAPIQERGWTAMLTGIGNTLQSRGGRLRAGSFSRWIRRL